MILQSDSRHHFFFIPNFFFCIYRGKMAGSLFPFEWTRHASVSYVHNFFSSSLSLSLLLSNFFFLIQCYFHYSLSCVPLPRNSHGPSKYIDGYIPAANVTQKSHRGIRPPGSDTVNQLFCPFNIFFLAIPLFPFSIFFSSLAITADRPASKTCYN